MRPLVLIVMSLLLTLPTQAYAGPLKATFGVVKGVGGHIHNGVERRRDRRQDRRGNLFGQSC